VTHRAEAVADAPDALRAALRERDALADRLGAAEQALAAASQRAERQRALSAALATASTVAEVAAAVVTHASQVLDAAGMVIARLTPDGAALEIVRAGAMPDDVQDDWRLIPLDAPVPLADVARTGEAVFLTSRDAWRERYPHVLPLVELVGHHANAVLPLVVDGRVLGALGAAYESARRFDEEERALAVAVALQCAQSIERARLFEAERTARRDAEEANRAKSAPLAVTSHELRTPLNAIGGYA